MPPVKASTMATLMATHKASTKATHKVGPKAGPSNHLRKADRLPTKPAAMPSPVPALTMLKPKVTSKSATQAKPKAHTKAKPKTRSQATSKGGPKTSPKAKTPSLASKTRPNKAQQLILAHLQSSPPPSTPMIVVSPKKDPPSMPPVCPGIAIPPSLPILQPPPCLEPQSTLPICTAPNPRATTATAPSTADPDALTAAMEIILATSQAITTSVTYNWQDHPFLCPACPPVPKPVRRARVWIRQLTLLKLLRLPPSSTWTTKSTTRSTATSVALRAILEPSPPAKVTPLAILESAPHHHLWNLPTATPPVFLPGIPWLTALLSTFIQYV